MAVKPKWSLSWACSLCMVLLLAVGTGAQDCTCPYEPDLSVDPRTMMATGTKCSDPITDNCLPPFLPVCLCTDRVHKYDTGLIICLDGGECVECTSDFHCLLEEICCLEKHECELPTYFASLACGDPHMTGFRGQKFDFTGEDGSWYALVADLPSMHVNMRVTSPVASVPEITYITGLAVITTDDDSIDHSIVISVIDPHTLTSACPAGVSPCLADGSLRVVADGKDVLAAPGTVTLAPGITMSAVNLPGPCRSFGFEKYWELKALQQAQVHRRLSETRMQSMADWILGDPTATNLEECTEYIARATAVGHDDVGLFLHQSEHASFQITTPEATIRLSHGRLHQLPMRDPTDRFDLPDHLTWQMNLGIDHSSVSLDSKGILGETLVPTRDASGQFIMQGMESIRGRQEDYRVADSLDVMFAQG